MLARPNVSGRGEATNRSFVATGENVVIRTLAATDVIETPFPFYAADTPAVSAAASVLGSFRLSFDTATGSLTNATASFSGVNF
ncbi:MAG: hypothetical protein ACJ8LN_04295 [Sulfurifustis sp.]